MKCAKTVGRLAAVLMMMLAGLSLSACGGGPSTNFVSSWRPPKAEPLAMRGEKVAAVVMMKDEIKRRNAEDVLAREITHYGAKGVPMYTLMDAPALNNEPAARAAIEGAGVKGVVVLRPTGTKTKTETHETYSSPMYNGYWGGYYAYGWSGAYMPGDWGSPHGSVPTATPGGYYGSSPSTVQTTTTTTKVLEVEVMVYSLKQNMLVWAGVSESTEPTKVDEFVVQLAAAVVRELGGQGLISN